MKQTLLALLVLALFSNLKMAPRTCDCRTRAFYYKSGNLVHVSDNLWKSQWVTGPGIKWHLWNVDGKDVAADSIVFKAIAK